MNQTQNNAIKDDELRVDIQAGDAYAATPRLKAALDELAAALEEADENDTAGFADIGLLGGFTLVYRTDTIAYTENDSKGKKKGNIEYSWKVEEGEGLA